MFDNSKTYWFAIRVSYGRVLKFCAGLKEAGMEYFVPMSRKKIEKDGKTSVVDVPAISNLCFVRSSRTLLEDIFASMGEGRYASFFWDKATRNPMVIPDKAMSDFIQISSIMSDDVLYLKDITAKLREGQKVRIKDGPFKGVEGKILRIRRSRRVVVDFPGLLAIATTYIDPRSLELL